MLDGSGTANAVMVRAETASVAMVIFVGDPRHLLVFSCIAAVTAMGIDFRSYCEDLHLRETLSGTAGVQVDWRAGQQVSPTWFGEIVREGVFQDGSI